MRLLDKRRALKKKKKQNKTTCNIMSIFSTVEDFLNGVQIRPPN